MELKRNILTRGLPKTGQTVCYHPGDDGFFEAGWWQGTTAANNRTRFIGKTIGGDDIVIDHATGLIWAADGNEAGCNNGADALWFAAIDYCLGLTFGGFSDWRLPNLKELFTLLEYDKALRDAGTSLMNALFTNTNLFTPYWSATTSLTDTLEAYVLNFYHSGIYTKEKGFQSNQLRAVRGGI